VVAKRNAGLRINATGNVAALPAAEPRMLASVVVVPMIAARTAATAAKRPASTTATATTATTGRPRRRRAGVEGDHPQNLNPLATLPYLAMDRGTFGCILQTGFLQRRNVEEDVRRTIRRRDEAESLFRVEPLDTPFKLGATLLALIGHFDHS
jgi:hypothetical protein